MLSINGASLSECERPMQAPCRHWVKQNYTTKRSIAHQHSPCLPHIHPTSSIVYQTVDNNYDLTEYMYIHVRIFNTGLSCKYS